MKIHRPVDILLLVGNHLSGARIANGETQRRVSARLQTMYRMIGSVQKEKNENDRR